MRKTKYSLERALGSAIAISILLAAASSVHASGVDLKFVFSSDAATSADPDLVDTIVQPTEAGRSVETEAEACGEGFTGQRSRTRDVISLSDGSTSYGAWSSWDSSGCAIAQVSSRTETESASCAAGFLGSSTRTREVAIMADSTEVPGSWSGWDTSGCHVGEVSRRTETENGTCPVGTLGSSSRSREISVMSDASEVPGGWSSWDTSGCHVGEVSRRTETENGTCPAGTLGSSSRSREISVMSDASEVPGAWSSWDTSACHVGEVSRRTDIETMACPSGFTGNQTRSQVVLVMSDNSERPQGWSAYDQSACVLAPVIKTFVETYHSVPENNIMTVGYNEFTRTTTYSNGVYSSTAWVQKRISFNHLQSGSWVRKEQGAFSCPAGQFGSVYYQTPYSLTWQTWTSPAKATISPGARVLVNDCRPL